ncbi:MAG: peroxidase family protein [Phycisphaerales bacterium]|jgi:hypothetical protein|nr:peroxidase family protein [Phycisphaerales bacterium]
MSHRNSWGTTTALAVILLAGTAHAQPYRSINGQGNNVSNPEWGSAHAHLRRLAACEYGDNIGALAGPSRPSPRMISNLIVAQNGVDLPSERVLTSFAIFWGQFIDHDMDLTDPPAGIAETAMIPVPTGDPFFDPASTGTQVIAFSRSEYDPLTGTDVNNPREQMNIITAYLDASMVYGSDPLRAAALRAGVDGKLLVSEGGFLPFNTFGLPNANPMGAPAASLFLAGDVRANEQSTLACLHTLFVREHNRRCDELKAQHPGWDDETLYQEARLWVGALVQNISLYEFLPALVGDARVPAYTGYDDSVDPSIVTEFSTGAFRMGHTMINPTLLRLDEDGLEIPEGHVPLRAAFFNPAILTEAGIEPFLLGLASQVSQEIDNKVVDDLRNFLFGQPGAGGLDLPSLNIQRGRDHGLPDLNDARRALGLTAYGSFNEITSDADLASRLQAAYTSVENIDLWVGLLAEDHLPGASVGEGLAAIMIDQFTRLRDGDRYWFENVMSPEEIAEVRATTLADVVIRNTTITNLQPNVFYVTGDFNNDAAIDSADFLAFLNAYVTSHPHADMNKDGVFNSSDFLTFLNAYVRNS